MEELKLFNCDIIGLSETKMKQTEHFTWKETGHEIILGSKVEGKNIGGVGFIISKKYRKMVKEVKIVSPRLATLKMELRDGRNLSIIQVYAPTGKAGDEEIETFYNELKNVITECGSGNKVVIGDFNATIGKGLDKERYIGKQYNGERNDAGERMADFCEEHGLYVGNTYFEKNPERRWTWMSPNGRDKTEIDYILCTNKKMMLNVEVMTKVKFPSDHRLVRAKITIGEKLKHITRRSTNIKKITTAENIYQAAITGTSWEYSNNATEDFEMFTNQINQCKKAAEVKNNHNSRRITNETKLLLAERRELQKDRTKLVQFAVTSKLCRMKMIEDIKRYRSEKMKTTMETGRSVKKLKVEMSQKRQVMDALKDQDGTKHTTKHCIEGIIKKFYTDLFASKQQIQAPELTLEEVPEIMPSEVERAIRKMKNGKSPGLDGITVEDLKAGGWTLCKVLSQKFSSYIKTGSIPQQWKTSKTVLLYKKGDKEMIKNYRPICLLSIPYKVFTKVLMNRMERILDQEQPREQAGFRSGFSTLDHIHTVRQLIEKCREFQLPLILIFIDYEKAFDSVEINAVLASLKNQGIDHGYINILKEIYSGCTTEITIFEEPIKVPIERGVRQGDTISPKLFTAAMEDVFRKLDWENYGIPIDGEKLNHLRFADDIVLITNNLKEAETMVKELEAESKKIGMKINMDKTQMMKNSYVATGESIKCNNQEIRETEMYTYLGQTIRMDAKLDTELGRRRAAGWTSFRNIREAMECTTDVAKKMKLFKTTVIPTLLYGSETWTTTKADIQKLEVTKRAMERRILSISLKDHVRNEDLKAKTGLMDADDMIMRNKLRWAGHVMRRTDERWTRKTTDWITFKKSWKAIGGNRSTGRPKTRWMDSLKILTHNVPWSRIAQDRHKWKTLLESRIQNK